MANSKSFSHQSAPTLENRLPHFTNERINKYIMLQHIFANINFNNVQIIAGTILNSNSLCVNTDIQHFWHLVRSHLIYSSNQNIFIPKLIANFCNILLQKDKLLGSRILKCILSEPNFEENFPTTIPFFYYLDYYHLLDRKEIVELVFKASCKTLLSLFIFYFWFAPILSTDFPKMYDTLTKKIKSQSQCPIGFEIFQSHLTEFSANDWELHQKFIEIGYFPNTIEAALKSDDLDLLLSLNNTLGQNQYGLNTFIGQSGLHISHFLQQRPTLLQFAAFFGSRKCFSYLFANGASLDVSETLESAYFASAGGCIDIIHDVYSRCSFSDGCLQMAAFSHRNNVFYWIYDKHKSEILLEKSKIFLPPLFFASSSNNVELVHFILSEMLENFSKEQLIKSKIYVNIKRTNESVKLYQDLIFTIVCKE